MMKPSSFSTLSFTLVLLLCFFDQRQAFTFNGFEIRDLESTNSNFAYEANSWTWSGLSSSVPYSNCRVNVLGGPGVLATICGIYNGAFGPCSQWGSYFRKTYTNLPEHSFVYFSITFWAFGAWDLGQDYFELEFDSFSIEAWEMTGFSFPFPTACGPASGEIVIYGRFAHSDPSISVTFYSRMDEATLNESWGVRDLKMLFVKNPASTSDFYCAAPWSIPDLPATWRCPFSNAGYFGTLALSACNTACRSCFTGSGSDQCYECNSGYFWTGNNCVFCHASCSVCYGSSNNQCNACNTGYYLWEGNTCIASCAPPLKQSPSTSAGVQLPALPQTVCQYPCAQGSFLDWNGDCQGNCDPPFRATTQTTSQNPIDICEYPCTLSQYLYWNGDCENECLIPLDDDIYHGRNLCKFPCNTAPNFIAYWNGDCKNTCDPPFNLVPEKGKQFCKTSCTGSYLYSNGSCLSTCQAHFQMSTISGQDLCKYPCASDRYLYKDGSCQPGCQTYYNSATLVGEKYCHYPCAVDRYFYQNGSCIADCPAPFNQRTVDGEKFCDFPCANPSNFAYVNRTCSSSCDSPYKQRVEGTFKFCDFSCEDGYALTQNGQCVKPQILSTTTKAVLKNSQTLNSATVQLASAVNYGRAISISASVGGRVFFNIKFLNISYSAELQEALIDWLPGFLSLGIAPNLPRDFVEKFPEREVPFTFAKYEVSASCFLNLWEDIGLLLIITATYVFLRIVEFLLISSAEKTVVLIQKYLRKLQLRVQNFLLVTAYGIWGDLFLFASLEYRSFEFAFDLSLFSFGITLLLIFVMLIGLYFHIRLIHRYQAVKKRNPDELEAFEKENECLSSLYSDFTDRSFAPQAFLVVLIVRELFFSIVITALYDYPIIQIGIFSANSILMTIYLLDQKPFKNKFDLGQQIFFEIIGLMVNISVLMNSVFPAYDHDGSELRRIVVIGRFIITLNFIFNFASAGFMLIQVSCTLFEYWKEYKLKRQDRKVSPGSVEMQEGSPEPPNIQVGQNLTIQTENSIFESRRSEQHLFITKRNNQDVSNLHDQVMTHKTEGCEEKPALEGQECSRIIENRKWMAL